MNRSNGSFSNLLSCIKLRVCETQSHSSADLSMSFSQKTHKHMEPPPFIKAELWDSHTAKSGMWSLHGQLYLAWRKCSLFEFRKPHHLLSLSLFLSQGERKKKTLATKADTREVDVQKKLHMLLTFNTVGSVCGGSELNTGSVTNRTNRLTWTEIVYFS